ncbi:MAG TPA: sigma-70 family RNA polymerase sigma factor [Puia sp.]|nr:sigma-70 family RNA polymerase sigma factor [Puia sp.]
MNRSTGNSLEDKYLVGRVLNGDTRAFTLIIRNTERLVAQIVFRLIPVAEDRKDLAQDIFLKAFHKLPAFRFQSKLSTWIAQIAYNTCISWLEKKRPLLFSGLEESPVVEEVLDPAYPEKDLKEPGFPDTGWPAEQLIRKERALILQKEINGLPPVYQTLITLFHQESMNYEELARVTGLPDGTVKSYLFRARRMLKENLLLKYKKEAL